MCRIPRNAIKRGNLQQQEKDKTYSQAFAVSSIQFPTSLKFFFLQKINRASLSFHLLFAVGTQKIPSLHVETLSPCAFGFFKLWTCK